jgi:hypothetical protein
MLTNRAAAPSIKVLDIINSSNLFPTLGDAPIQCDIGLTGTEWVSCPVWLAGGGIVGMVGAILPVQYGSDGAGRGGLGRQIRAMIAEIEFRKSATKRPGPSCVSC